MESLFVENDYKRHMSVNTETGLWRCFKTGRCGNFISLYAQVTGRAYFAAQTDLYVRNFERLHYHEGIDTRVKVLPTKSVVSNLSLGNIKQVLTRTKGHDNLIDKAIDYLESRGFHENHINKFNFFVSLDHADSKLGGRLIIPFIKDGILYFYQARSLNNQEPKYTNPSSSCGVKASDILYPYDENSDHLVITEGPIDCLSLKMHDINATCTMGSAISASQLEILRTFKGKIILGYDSDEAGQKGVYRFNAMRKSMRLPEFYVASLPTPLKDWNDAHRYDFDLKTIIRQAKLADDYYFLENELK